ncbi:alpha/beta fold hydrolase [Luteimonas sp. WGS1318]|uniref:alpha/beta fold hydrolase n=1 Tax=Luteimonas sp. WGS1318 TaxID=3366815 RepID=UPI00372D092C
MFSHANGFPAATYAQMLAPLRAHFDISHVDAFGHEPRYPVSRGWPGLSRQLLDHIEARTDARPVWLLGHSLGGYLSVLAAAQLGSRVRGVVLLDSPLIGGVTAHLVKLGRRTGLDRHLMPLRQTLQRRTHWPDVDAVRAHFAAKPAFARWDPRVLSDYASAATLPDALGRRLLFDREIEHRIYATLPTRSVQLAARHVSAPMGFIAGRHSREVSQIGLRATRARVGARVAWIDGSHLYPMERPDETARSILTMIEGMRTEAVQRRTAP